MSEVSKDDLNHELVSDTSSIASQNADSVGAQLARAREQRGWTVQYVAEQLKLSQSQIFALEANQLDKLPKLVIVRGFVRAYSKLLRIDADALMSLMPQDCEPVRLEASLRPALSTPFIESRTSLSGHQENNRRYIIGLVVLVLAVMVIVFFQRTDYGQALQGRIFSSNHKAENVMTAEVASSQPYEAVSTPSSTATISDQMVVASTSTGVNSNDVVASSPALNAVPVNAPSEIGLAASSAVVTPPASNLQASGAASSAALQEPMAISDTLVLKFKEDSWVFVKIDGGAVLSSHVAKAGSEEVFSVKQGLFVKLGNAAGVQASLRGKPFAIVADRETKVASVSVR